MSQKRTSGKRRLKQKRHNLKQRKRRKPGNRRRPVLSGKSHGPRPRYEVSERVQATAAGGVGAIHNMVCELGLAEAIDRAIPFFKRRQPYHESDHVLALAYSFLAGGRNLEDLDALRDDAALLDMLGAEMLPDPTTAGDFLRRFAEDDVWALQRVLNGIRPKLWERGLPREERRVARIDADGTIVPTTSEKMEGMDISYNGQWGTHPLLVSLANTQEPLILVNRPGNQKSSQDATGPITLAAELVEPHFDAVLLRGDTDFSLTGSLDGWDARGWNFVFGYKAVAPLLERAMGLSASAWTLLKRRDKYGPRGASRSKRPNIKEEIVEARGYEKIELVKEHYAEFEYKPIACSRPYRMVVLRKTLKKTKGRQRLLDEERYFFYITNHNGLRAPEVIGEANDRCNQENLIEQLKNGVPALKGPAHDLVSNWAYMVIASLSWSLKAWFALTQPDASGRQTLLRMEFPRFLQGLMRIPAQVLRQGRRLIVRLLAYTPHAHRLLDAPSLLPRGPTVAATG